MKQAFSVFKYEFFRYFNSPVAFVYLIAFLLLNGFCAFYLGNILERGIADLTPMFGFMPWLFLFFIPAISMRLWAEEYKSNTIYQTLSLPISISQLTIGKFLAAWAFSALGIALTFEFWITLNLIASPDNSIILWAYISSIILSGALVSVALFASSITQNQVIALIIGICLILFLFLSGIDFVINLYKPFLSAQTIDIISSFSILNHYTLMIDGLIELKALLFLISIIVLFIFLSIISIKNKFAAKSNYKSLIFFAFVAFIGFNLIAAKSIAYIDVSKDGKHTLSHSTEYILENIKEPITAKLYYSEILSKKNPEFKKLFNSVYTLLKQYQQKSNGKLILDVYYPKTLSETEDIAIASGLKGMPIIDSNQNAFFGLILTDAINNKEVVELLTPNNSTFLEPLITQKIYLLNHKKQNIGIISGVEMFENVVGGVATQNWQIINQLSSFYNIKKIDNKSPEIKDISALMIVSPKDLSKELLENINKYKNNGGKFLILLDPAPEAIRNFAPQTEAIKASDSKAIEENFGFRFLKEAFVADFDNSLTVDATIDYTQNPIITQDLAQILLTKDNINQDILPTAGLQNILLSSTSIIAPNKEANVEFIPLLKASKNSSLMNINYIYKNINPSIILSEFQKDNYQKFMAAKIIEKKSNNPFKAIVIADSDFIYDNFLNSTNNLYFVLNALDELVGNHSLLSLRAKTKKEYRFNFIENIRKKAQLEYIQKETELLKNIRDAKVEVQKTISKKHFEDRKSFISDELTHIAKVRKNLSTLKNSLGSLKENAYNKIEQINNLAKFINIYLLPLLILLVMLASNQNKNKTTNKKQMYISKKSLVFAFSAILIFIIGLSLHLSVQKKQTNTLVFKNLPIEQTTKIVIKKDNQSVELYKKDNIWQIANHQGFRVFDDRITGLLSSISLAKYYEKKSQQIKNLPYFGLDEKNATHITLYNNDQIITDFYIGEYDIDLGRGTRGAYYRSADNYDVWLIDADLIDVSPNWREYCYSFVWSLRYGKATNSNIETIKAMIASPLLNAQSSIASKTPDFSININTTKKDITIAFYQVENKHYIKYNFDAKYYEISQEDYNKIKDTNSGSNK